MPAGLAVPYEIRSHAGGAVPAKLNTTMAVTALSFTLQAGQGASYPDGTSGPFFVSLDAGAAGEEHVRIVSRSGDTFNCNSLADRGLMGTTALQHQQGAAVTHGPSALEADESSAVAHNTLGQISNPGDMLYADTSGTMAAFAKGSAGQSPVYQADSSVAAGNPIPAPHTHVPSDIVGLVIGALLARNQTTAYPARTETFVGQPSDGAVDLVGATVTLIAPASGHVWLTADGLIVVGGDGFYPMMYWKNHSGGAVLSDQRRIGNNDAVSSIAIHSFSQSWLVTGLTGGDTYTLDLWGGINGGTEGYGIADVSVAAWAA